MNLHDVLKNSYSKHKKEQLGNYRLDRKLSNANQQVYFNQHNGKLHYNVNGTRNLRDWAVDALAPLGLLKSTNRYKQADETLKKAKEKYNVKNATISGHSLGGAISSRVAKPEDKVYSLNRYSLGDPIKANEMAYRTKNDVVSLLSMNAKNMKTIKTNNSINPISSHNVKTIKNENINII